MSRPGDTSEIELEGREWPLIPPGEYTLRYVKHESKMYLDIPRVFVHLEIIDQGEHFGIQLFKAYCLKKSKAPSTSGKSYALSRNQALYIDLCKIGEEKIRADRFSLISIGKIFRGKAITGTVRTVQTTYRGDVRPECLQYSVVDKLLYTNLDKSFHSEDQTPIDPSPPTFNHSPDTVHHISPPLPGKPKIAGVSGECVAKKEGTKKRSEDQTVDEWLADYCCDKEPTIR